MRQESTIRDGGPGYAGQKPKHPAEPAKEATVTEWILMLTLYSKSGAPPQTLTEHGFSSEWECGKRAADLATDILLTTPGLRNIKPLCIQDDRKKHPSGGQG